MPQAVVCGFEWAIETPDLWEMRRRLDLLRPDLRGFGYEGAAMACTVLDAAGTGRGNRTRQLLLGPGQPHIFLAYIGIGFGMARLPRSLWKRCVPDLTGAPYYPTMSWFAVDGYAFDRAYFATRKWVDEQRVPPQYPWQGCPEYFLRAFDQGVGRALWFIHAGVPEAVATAVGRFSDHRRADLWSGIGLAATFAGGCTDDALDVLVGLAGRHSAEVGLGAVLACKGRSYAEHVPRYTRSAVQRLAGLSVDGAVDLADRCEVNLSGDSAEPAYELWRQKIRAELDAAQYATVK